MLIEKHIWLFSELVRDLATSCPLCSSTLHNTNSSRF